jgi:hypothetical protein
VLVPKDMCKAEDGGPKVDVDVLVKVPYQQIFAKLLAVQRHDHGQQK